MDNMESRVLIAAARAQARERSSRDGICVVYLYDGKAYVRLSTEVRPAPAAIVDSTWRQGEEI